MKSHIDARCLFLCVELFLVGAFAPLHNRAGLPNIITLGTSRLWTRPNFLPEGFSIDVPDNNLPKPPKKPFKVTSVAELKDLFRQGYRVRDFDVRGNTRVDASIHRAQVHPVVKALYERKEMKSEPGNRKDGRKIGLAIEGGGMRGCVSAGMVTAVWYLGLQESVDIVYGSSAGSLVGAYFVTGQLPYFGPEIYYDVLTTAGEEFIDKGALLRSVGLGALDLRMGRIKNLMTTRMGRPVLNLHFLLDTIVQSIKPLEWDKFWELQTTKKLQLKVIASGLLTKKAVVMSAEAKNFQTVAELGHCMKASMLLPGVTGDVIRLKDQQLSGNNLATTWWKEWENDRRGAGDYIPGSEPMADSQLFQPIPYRAAIDDGCTHVLVVRTVADGQSIIKKLGIMEKLIMLRFFAKKLKMQSILSWMSNQLHKLVYAEDILRLNEANRKFDDKGAEPKLFCVALPPGVPEVKRFETSRRVIFENVRDGFAAAYDALVIDPSQKGKGSEIAKTIWPDSILNQQPVHLIKNDRQNAPDTKQTTSQVS